MSTSSSQPTNVEQDCPPLFPDYHLDAFLLSGPFQHTSPSIPLEPRFGSSCDSLDPSIPSFTGYANPSLGTSTAVPPGSYGGPEYDTPSPVQPHLHEAVETTPETLYSFSPFALPHSIAPLMTQYSQSFAEPTPDAMGALDRTRGQAAPSSSNFHGFGGNAAVVQPHLREVVETAPETLHSCSPFAPHSHSLLEPTHIAPDPIDTLDQTQAQAASSSTFHGFGGNAPSLPAPPVLPSPANPTQAPPNTVHICQCATSGSPCNAAVGGSTLAVRRHLKRAHGFCCVGKDRVTCLWLGCGKEMQRQSIPRHIVSCHFRAGVLCIECGAPLSRRDVRFSHVKACPAMRRRF